MNAMLADLNPFMDISTDHGGLEAVAAAMADFLTADPEPTWPSDADEIEAILNSLRKAA